ncbi:MAG TPA: DUF3800 domain-containing protein [Cyclobacteriaceae bacterium]|nr:DUF3800 domain-containing protein [Cyclobacteriaceae bacterium]
MLIFLDESGDLGWSFNRPNGHGGSSRYVTIAGIILEENAINQLTWFILELYRKYNLTPGIEKKGASFSSKEAAFIIRGLRRLQEHSPSFRIISITARKENTGAPLRRDSNIFYNYLLNVLLTDQLKHVDLANITLDNRAVKVGSDNSFEECLKTKCWGELGLQTQISVRYDNSDQNYGIWIADWIANFIWRYYEKESKDGYHELKYFENQFSEKLVFR